MRREKMDHPVEKLTDWDALSLFGERESNERRELRGLPPRKDPRPTVPYEDRGVIVDTEKLNVGELMNLETCSLMEVKMHMDPVAECDGSPIPVSEMAMAKYIAAEREIDTGFVHHNLVDPEKPGLICQYFVPCGNGTKILDRKKPFVKREDPNVSSTEVRKAMRSERQAMGTLPMGKVPPKWKRAITIARKKGQMLDQQAWFNAPPRKHTADVKQEATEAKPWKKEPWLYRLKDRSKPWSETNALAVY